MQVDSATRVSSLFPDRPQATRAETADTGANTDRTAGQPQSTQSVRESSTTPEASNRNESRGVDIVV